MRPWPLQLAACLFAPWQNRTVHSGEPFDLNEFLRDADATDANATGAVVSLRSEAFFKNFDSLDYEPTSSNHCNLVIPRAGERTLRSDLEF